MQDMEYFGKRHGDYLPDDLDFKTVTGSNDDRQAVAEALHQDIIGRTDSIWLTWWHDFDTMAGGLKGGLESFLEDKTDITDVTVSKLGWTSLNQIPTAKSLINSDKPFLLVLNAETHFCDYHTYADYEYFDYNRNARTGAIDKTWDVSHVVVAYGYRTVDGNTEIICHFGHSPNIQHSPVDPNDPYSLDLFYSYDKTVQECAAKRRIWLSDLTFGGLVYLNEEHTADSYSNFTSSLHRKYCYCGQFLGDESHDCRNKILNDIYHTRYCMDCSYSVSELHNLRYTDYGTYGIATCINCPYSFRYTGPIAVWTP